MNVLLWITQIVLALFAVSGGAFKIFQFEELAKVPAAAALPRGAWGALGLLELVCGVLLIMPVATKRVPMLTPAGAAILAMESVALAAVYARYSKTIEPANPLVWVVFMAVLAPLVAYGRYSR